MYSDEENDITPPEKLPVFNNGKEIFDMVSKIAALIPDDDIPFHGFEEDPDE